MTPRERDDLLHLLQHRFDKHMARHRGLNWADMLPRLDGRHAVLESLHQMERSGGEPDVIGRDPHSGLVVFCDCSAESPPGRRSLCYDQAALDARKEHKPGGSVVEAAAVMGAELLDDTAYRELQSLGVFDAKTSSWLATPPELRALGGALFGDYRYGRVFVYHNGASSYYAGRGFRARLKV